MTAIDLDSELQLHDGAYLVAGFPRNTWGTHIQEMTDGVRTDALDAEIRPEYDPAITSLNDRIASKAAELRASGTPASPASLRRMKRDFENAGRPSA